MTDQTKVALPELTDQEIKDFLESAPLYARKRYGRPSVNRTSLHIQQIDDHCDVCEERRPFGDIRPRGGGSGMAVPRLDTGRSYFEFTCLTCRRASRRYYVVQFVTDEHVDIEKAGQYPRPRLPRNRHVQRFMADDAANYEKAIACLANAYGIGAFAYYRRLVEDNIGRLLELVQEDAAASSSGTETLAALKQLGTNCPMAEKLKIANDAVPAHLKPDGLNPLGRLYGALSEGIHSLSEEQCLNQARLIDQCLAFLLAELADRKKHREEFKRSVGGL